MTSGASLALSGCASFDGQAAPVLTTDMTIAVASSLPPVTALETFYAEPDPARRTAWRDRVIGSYLAAADAQYLAFRAKLSREMKGSNTALGLIALGLTGGASLASEATANALSAGASGVIGARSTISKELWFEKTLPALMTAMSANRTRIRTEIMVRMREDAGSYSLSEAFSDIARYQEAASLDGAVETVTSAAGQKAREADELYAQEVSFNSAAPEEGGPDLRRTVKQALAGIGDDSARMDAAAAAVNIVPGTRAIETRGLILMQMNQIVSVEESRDFAARVLAAVRGDR